MRPIFHLEIFYLYTYLKLVKMASMKKLNDFLGKALNTQETNEVKGGKAYVPTDTGSVGYINWDDVVIRENNFQTSTSESMKAGLTTSHKGR